MKKNILFLTRNGLLEPLGQSQILSYLVPLSQDFNIHIVSFEKRRDLEDLNHLNQIKEKCKSNNIQWSPLTYRKTFRSLGITIGFIDLLSRAWSLCASKKIDCIHARSYYPAFIALLLFKTKNIPFIFDMRALWPEELVEAGRLKKGRLAWKTIKGLEKKCLKHASKVISLTYAAVTHLDKENPSYELKNKTVVIPTCADLDRFEIKTIKKEFNHITLSCVGSMLSGWFKIDVLKNVLNYMLTTYANVNFEFLTRDSKQDLLNYLDPTKKWEDRIIIESVLFRDMPKRLSSHDGSMFFFTSNISKLGSAPTRMAEILGTGTPILTNAGVGDVDTIILENSVGQLLNPNDTNDIENSCDLFVNMIKQNEIAARCRATSERLFSLDSGVQKYRRVYQDLL